jgi:chemotaxis protein MotB
MKKKPKAQKDNTERWLLSYADFMTLLLAFFIIMYASSQISQAKFIQIAQSFKTALGGGQSIIGSSSLADIKQTPQLIQKNYITQTTPSSNSTATAGNQQEQNTLKQLQQQINAYIDANNMQNSVSTQIDDTGLLIRIQDALAFDSGQANIKPEWIGHLSDISKMLNTINNYIRIEGHTDNVPINTPQFQDNLALSCARAENVYRVFATQGGINPARMSADGYGDTRPIADNSTDAGKAKNRRVDIIVLDTKYNGIESTN